MDEQQVLEILEDASDYERGFGRLDEQQKGLVEKLQEAAGELSKVVGKKQKHVSSISSGLQLELTNQRP